MRELLRSLRARLSEYLVVVPDYFRPHKKRELLLWVADRSPFCCSTRHAPPLACSHVCFASAMPARSSAGS